jgi:hypothetical protein
VLLKGENEMTLNEKKPSLLFGIDENTENEIWVEIDNENLFLLAELIAEDSTVRDRKAFYKLYPGAPDYEDEYEHEFAADYNSVREFADTHKIDIWINQA